MCFFLTQKPVLLTADCYWVVRADTGWCVWWIHFLFTSVSRSLYFCCFRESYMATGIQSNKITLSYHIVVFTHHATCIYYITSISSRKGVYFEFHSLISSSSYFFVCLDPLCSKNIPLLFTFSSAAWSSSIRALYPLCLHNSICWLTL